MPPAAAASLAVLPSKRVERGDLRGGSSGIPPAGVVARVVLACTRSVFIGVLCYCRETMECKKAGSGGGRAYGKRRAAAERTGSAPVSIQMCSVFLSIGVNRK